MSQSAKRPSTGPLSQQPTAAYEAEVIRLGEILLFWQEQADQIERDRVNLRKLLPIGPIFALVLLAITRLWWPSCLSVAAVTGVWGMGVYMCGVRRVEYAYHCDDVRAQLRRLERTKDTQTTRPDALDFVPPPP